MSRRYPSCSFCGSMPCECKKRDESWERERVKRDMLAKISPPRSVPDRVGLVWFLTPAQAGTLGLKEGDTGVFGTVAVREE